MNQEKTIKYFKRIESSQDTGQYGLIENFSSE